MAVQRNTAVLIDLAFKAAVTIGLAVGGWLFTRIESHESRLIRVETQNDATAEKIEAINKAVQLLDAKADQLLGWAQRHPVNEDQ